MDFLRAIAARIAGEPVLVRTVAGGVIALAAIFGVTLNNTSLDPIVDFIGVLAGLIVSLTARAKVTPV